MCASAYFAWLYFGFTVCRKAACCLLAFYPHSTQATDKGREFCKASQIGDRHQKDCQACLQAAVYLQLGFWPVAIISGIEPRVSQCGHAQAEHACQKLCCYDGYQGPGDVRTNLGCHEAKEYATGSTHNEDSPNQALPVSACKPQSVVVATE